MKEIKKNERRHYVAPEIVLTNVIIEQHVLANGSSIDLETIEGEYW